MKDLGNEVDEENTPNPYLEEELLSRMPPNERKTYEMIMKEATPKMDESDKYSQEKVDLEIRRLLDKNPSFSGSPYSQGVVHTDLDTRRQILRFMIYLDLKEEYKRKQK